MRHDYGLYLIAIICFVLAVFLFMGYTGYIQLTTGNEVTDLVVAMFSAVLGVVFVGMGHGIRPKEAVSIQPAFSQTACMHACMRLPQMQQNLQSGVRQAKDLKTRALKKGLLGISPLKSETVILTAFPALLKHVPVHLRFPNGRLIFSNKDLNLFCARGR